MNLAKAKFGGHRRSGRSRMFKYESQDAKLKCRSHQLEVGGCWRNPKRICAMTYLSRGFLTRCIMQDVPTAGSRHPQSQHAETFEQGGVV